MSANRILITESPDQTGLIAKITTICFSQNLNIVNNSEFVDRANNRFFMRTELEGHVREQILMRELKSALPPQARQRLVKGGKKKLVVFATKEAHCLGELLLKSQFGSLNTEILAVISNHQNLDSLVRKFSIPFYFIDHQDLSRSQHEQLVNNVLEKYQFDYLVLAKYMRVLTPGFVALYPNRIVNIHHSFLPAFVGAKPYHQAYERGVKIIGATAHFVNNDLDEGPIIAQGVVPVDHSYGPEDMIRAGREVEESVLTSALHMIAEEKVIVTGNKTVVFS